MGPMPGLIDMHTHVADGHGQTDDPAEPLKQRGGDDPEGRRDGAYLAFRLYDGA